MFTSAGEQMNPPYPFTYQSFEYFLSQNQLKGSRCLACGAIYLPPRAICRRCHAERMEWISLTGEGKLAAFTAIAVGPSDRVEQGFDRSHPYLSGIVELEEGVRVAANILGLDAHHPEAIQIGIPVMVEFLQTKAEETRKTTLAFRPI
jgi:hypothetical protein